MHIYQKLITANINSPFTSSVGRIFDVVAALLGLCNQVSYEGQAAIILEQTLKNTKYGLDDCYEFFINNKDGKHIISLDKTYFAILQDKNKAIPLEIISWKFHNTMVKIIYETCLIISDTNKIKTIVLSGGCFQNKFLLESTINVLSNKGFTVLYHKEFPTNDGSISLGQAAHVIYGREVN